MTETAELKRTIKVCMFDQYGTVVDMQGGLVKVAAPYLKAKGWTGNPNSFVTWWRRTHFENSMIDALLHKAHTPYREIGQRSVAYVLDRCKLPYTMDEVRALVAEIEKLECFPEVPAALARLQTRYKLVVLSNGDRDMLETAKQYQTARCDLHEGSAIARPAHGRGAVCRQPCIRLYRCKGSRHAHRIHQPAPAALWHHPAPTGRRGSHHDRPR